MPNHKLYKERYSDKNFVYQARLDIIWSGYYPFCLMEF